MLMSLRAPSPIFKEITDSTDATDFIFSRILFTLGFVTDFIAPDGAGLAVRGFKWTRRNLSSPKGDMRGLGNLLLPFTYSLLPKNSYSLKKDVHF